MQLHHSINLDSLRAIRRELRPNPRALFLDQELNLIGNPFEKLAHLGKTWGEIKANYDPLEHDSFGNGQAYKLIKLFARYQRENILSLAGENASKITELSNTHGNWVRDILPSYSLSDLREKPETELNPLLANDAKKISTFSEQVTHTKGLLELFNGLMQPLRNFTLFGLPHSYDGTNNKALVTPRLLPLESTISRLEAKIRYIESMCKCHAECKTPLQTGLVLDSILLLPNSLLDKLSAKFDKRIKSARTEYSQVELPFIPKVKDSLPSPAGNEVTLAGGSNHAAERDQPAQFVSHRP